MRLDEDSEESNSAWMQDFRRVVNSAKVTTHEITSLLCLLSASITNRQPLPPYLKAPRPYSFSKRLEALDKDILSIEHIAEPGFAAFAVLQISTRCIVGDVDRLMRFVSFLFFCGDRRVANWYVRLQACQSSRWGARLLIPCCQYDRREYHALAYDIACAIKGIC